MKPKPCISHIVCAFVQDEVDTPEVKRNISRGVFEGEWGIETRHVA
jgi:hypothetical protein